MERSDWLRARIGAEASKTLEQFGWHKRCLPCIHSCRVGDNATLAAWGTMLRIFENQEHWRKRAEEARGIAAECNDLETTHLMLGLALAYDDLAERANERREPQQALTDGPDEHLEHHGHLRSEDEPGVMSHYRDRR